MAFEETELTGKFDTDYLDEYCMRVYGHTHWSFVPNDKADLHLFAPVITRDAGMLVMFFAYDETDGEEEGR
jgi:hypothetical protein